MVVILILAPGIKALSQAENMSPKGASGNTIKKDSLNIENATRKKDIQRGYYRSSIIAEGLVPGIRYSYNSKIGFFVGVDFLVGINDTKTFGGGIMGKIAPKTFMNVGLKIGKHHYSTTDRVTNETYFRPEISLQTQFKRFTILYGLELFCRNTEDSYSTTGIDKLRITLPVFGAGFNF
jgi:hypothetical protein